jgi:tight adherence protein C
MDPQYHQFRLLMPENPIMLEFEAVHWLTFLAISSFVLLAYLLLQGRRDRLDARLERLAGKEDVGAQTSQTMGEMAMSVLPTMGAALMPSNEEQRTQLQARLIHAGLYSRTALVVFLGIKLMLTVGPAVIGLLAGLVGIIPIFNGLIFGAILGISGMIGPSFWLDRRKAARQMAFRRALPDAMDVIVICLEGGLSLPGAIRRVANELRTAHPALATELIIVQREVQMGRTTGDALKQFAERCDLEEIRSLASVINQSERFGASLVKALRTHAETLRGKRLQFAEETAQKAAIKILFPTLLCIFPGMFLVILGPAAIQLAETFSRFKK